MGLGKTGAHDLIQIPYVFVKSPGPKCVAPRVPRTRVLRTERFLQCPSYTRPSPALSLAQSHGDSRCSAIEPSSHVFQASSTGAIRSGDVGRGATAWPGTTTPRSARRPYLTTTTTTSRSGETTVSRRTSCPCWAPEEWARRRS